MTSLYLKNLREHTELFATLGTLEPQVGAAATLAMNVLRDGRKLN